MNASTKSTKSTKTATLEERVITLEQTITMLTERLDAMPKARDRGPTSTRTMTDDDAERVCYGDLEDMSHKDAAKELGLSYAQVYSARGQYTFKNIHKLHATTSA